MTAPAAMTVANDETIIQMINAASQRLVILAPGLSKAIAIALAAKWTAFGVDAVTIILDIDPEVCRLGYGEIESLTILQSAAARIGGLINHQPGVRIGLVIADQQTLVFAPTPQLIEATAPPTSPAVGTNSIKPNAIRLGLPPADVERDLGLGPDGIIERMIGLDTVSKSAIEKTAKSLEQNPPQKFDVARRVRVFNAQFEFVEIEIKGAMLQRKTVRLPNYLLGIADNDLLDKAMHATFRVIDQESGISGDRLQLRRALIIKRYLKHLPTHGFIVMRKDKLRLERALARLQRAVDRFRTKVRDQLQDALEAKRVALTAILIPQVQPRLVALKASDFRPPTAEQIVDQTLRPLFAEALNWVDRIDLRVAFKGVTYESLCDPHFMRLVRERLPDALQLVDEFDAARGFPLPQSTSPPPPSSLKGAA